MAIDPIWSCLCRTLQMQHSWHSQWLSCNSHVWPSLFFLSDVDLLGIISWMQKLYWKNDAFKSSTHFDHIKTHYYWSHASVRNCVIHFLNLSNDICNRSTPQGSFLRGPSPTSDLCELKASFIDQIGRVFLLVLIFSWQWLIIDKWSTTRCPKIVYIAT